MPDAWALRECGQGRWIEFHSLPGGKRHADTQSEYAEVLRRHRTVLSELLDGDDLMALTVIAVDWGRRDLATGQARRKVPDAWPWRRFVDEDDIDAPMYCWVQDGLTRDQLDAILLAAAKHEGGRYILTTRALAWLFCPCEGGADVCTRSIAHRKFMAARHADWLADRSEAID